MSAFSYTLISGMFVFNVFATSTTAAKIILSTFLSRSPVMSSDKVLEENFGVRA